jgi:hypothetical protein
MRLPDCGGTAEPRDGSGTVAVPAYDHTPLVVVAVK